MDSEDIFEQNKQRLTTGEGKEVSEAVSDLINQRKEFEKDRVELAKSSEKKAWRVAVAFGVLAALAVLAVVLITPLKTLVPFMIKVDNATGHAEVVQPISDGDTVTYGEVLDKYWTKTYITHRNSYTWQTIQSDYDAVYLMSSGSVFRPYQIELEGENSIVEKFGEDRSVEIDVKGISFIPGSESDNMIARVQFTRTIKGGNGEDALNYRPVTWEATLSFDYQAKVKKEEDRLINPLGYRVTTYREDKISE